MMYTYRGVGDQDIYKGKMRKKRNPVGSKGQLLRCKSNGSLQHLFAECIDSWEIWRTITVNSNM